MRSDSRLANVLGAQLAVVWRQVIVVIDLLRATSAVALHLFAVARSLRRQHLAVHREVGNARPANALSRGTLGVAAWTV